MVDGLRTTIERITGSVPPTCPWRVMEEPIVLDVLKVHWWLDSGEVGTRLPDDPPNVLIEGVEEFGGAYNACEHEKYARQREAAKNRGKGGKPPPRPKSTPKR